MSSRHIIMKHRSGGSSLLPIDTGYACGTSGTMRKTTNGGSTWANTAALAGNHNALFFLTTQLGYVADDDGDVHKTSNGGSAWTTFAAFTAENHSGIHVPQTSVIFTSTRSGGIWKSVDDGASWQKKHNDATLILESIHFFSQKTGAAVGNRAGAGKFLYSNNNGNNWTEKITPVTNIHGVWVLGASIALICGDDGAIYKTNNAGDSWTNVSVATGNELLKIRFITGTPNVGYICGTGGSIFKTVNSGDSWTSVLSPIGANTLSGINFIDENTGYVCEDDPGILATSSIWKTTNGGTLWTLQDDIANEFKDITFPRQ